MNTLPSGKKEILLTDSQDLIYVCKDLNIISDLRFIHTHPDITSKITIKAVFTKQCNFDVQATVVIEKLAIQTDSYLKFQILNLTNDSHIRIVPSLEINNKEVKGGHSATIQNINDEQLYYLMTKGIDKDDAIQLLIQAFLEE